MTDSVLRPNLKYELWMERRFAADLTVTPTRVVYECRYYMKLPKGFDPILRRLAANVKNRLLVLQRIWDEKGKDSKLYLILCGSFIGFMEREVLGHKSPLYGRWTGQLLVHPLLVRTLKGFFPGYSPEERITAYVILGGVPAYLIQFSDKLSIRQNIEKQILSAPGKVWRIHLVEKPV